MTDPTSSRYRFLRLKNDVPQRRFVKSDSGLKEELSIVQSSVEVPHGSYGTLLFRPEWMVKRATIIDRDQKRCILCNSFENLQVHHRQYHFVVKDKKFKLPWDYPDHLLITLCESCHSRGHSKYKVPTINI